MTAMFTGGALIAQFRFVSDAVRCFPSVRIWASPLTHMMVPLPDWELFKQAGGLTDPEFAGSFTWQNDAAGIRITPKEEKR